MLIHVLYAGSYGNGCQNGDLWYCSTNVLVTIQTVDIPTETIKLADAQTSVDPGSVSTHISSTSPRYSFYHYPGSDVVVFVYTCPTGSSIKERMLHASSRRTAITVAENEGLKILKKVRRGAMECASGNGANKLNNRLRLRHQMKLPQSGWRKKSTRRQTRVQRADLPVLVAQVGKL